MMDWLTRILATIAPHAAANRIAGQARIKSAQRLFDAVSSQAYRPRRGSGASADVAMDNARGRLWEYARWLDDNHDLATGVLDDLVSNIVGTGIGIEPMVRDAKGNPAERLNDDLRKLWESWWLRPEVTGEIPGKELERMVCRTWLRDGELFVQHINAPSIKYPTDIPYLLAPLEADFVPWDLVDTNGSQPVTHGVIKSTLGRPLAYHVYKTHPGNTGRVGLLSSTTDTIIVGAENMMHLKFTRRFHQTRGNSLLHSVFTRLDDLKDYEESERVAARVAAAFSAYIKKGSDYDSAIDEATSERQFEMRPGMVFDNLLPGEEVGTIDTSRPNNNVENYISIQERRIAAGTGSRGSAVARNYNGTYSAQRQELVEGSVHYRRLFGYLAEKFYLPTWKRFIDAARMSGTLRVPMNIDLATLYRPELRAPSLPWIDPKKEVEAMGLAIEKGLRSRQQCIRDLGGDPRQVDAQIKADTFKPPAAAPAMPTAEPADDSNDSEEQAA